MLTYNKGEWKSPLLSFKNGAWGVSDILIEISLKNFQEDMQKAGYSCTSKIESRIEAYGLAVYCHRSRTNWIVEASMGGNRKADLH